MRCRGILPHKWGRWQLGVTVSPEGEASVNVSGQWRECDRCGLRETKGLGR